jgi:PKHD-type hydroxylase
VTAGQVSTLPFVWAPPAAHALVAAANARRGFSSTDGKYHGIQGKETLQSVVRTEAVFSAAECAQIKVLGHAMPMWSGRMTSRRAGSRRCTVSWLEERPDTSWIYDRLRALVLEANSRFDFEIHGFAEPFHFLEYAEGGKIDWHTDLHAGAASTRKLSLSIQLSARDSYEGGELELCPHGVIGDFSNAGDVIVFPAYIPHRVRPVTRGVRHALVSWIHGAAFR